MAAEHTHRVASTRYNRGARQLVGLVIAGLCLYFMVVAFASIPRQVFFPDTIAAADCTKTSARLIAQINAVVDGHIGGGIDIQSRKAEINAKLEGLREHCPSSKVRILMRANERAWSLYQQRLEFHDYFKLKDPK